MSIITRKSEVAILLERSLATYDSDGVHSCVEEVYDKILTRRVKFPLLEYCGTELYQYLLRTDHIPFCDQVEALHTEGGNVILGIILQKRLEDHFQESIDKATEYIANADIWYVCDIIGERVFGFSLLQEPEKTIIEIKRLATHPTNWVSRSLGAGVHYAIKKGLNKNHVDTLFRILLSMANTIDKEIRQGVGWAAKTTAKFHPDIIKKHGNEIQNTEQVANWFRTKISIGLDRNNYAQRNNR